ncbi:hypothetical protein GCM10011611_33380 [Aliidongia dinghuensis]|uniref:Uncharacterized protein n=1 Tax=Aliidongia dinghuensis TaxID=1867774 RepID=A0A8J2YUP7_9PROT|nr:DUF5691 domain-containing protein [Aliidongia dinghuensis]GGF24655.1 hypothetical protein GCM10011611_33380 [Aliidongia dinghuensis]
MAEAIYDAMGAVLTRWTMGAAAAPAASPWRAELGAEPAEAELRLLALTGQFLGVAVTADPPVGLRTLPDVPGLALPTVPEALRPLVRRILAATKATELLPFLAARGWTAHPADWMPAPNDEDIPDVYAPWRDWVAAAAAGSARRRVEDGLTAENWDDYWPAARKAALTELRRRDPGAARALLAVKLANEGADVRLRLVGLLAVGLSDADIPYLEDITATDRAPKVKALGESLLARLGRGPAAGAEAAELAGFFPVQVKGLLRRSRVIQFETLKTPAQRVRRTALFEVVDIAAFARALKISPEELIAAWTWDVDRQADAALVALVARTGTDALVTRAADAVSQCDAVGLQNLAALAPRLTAGQRSALAAKVLHASSCSFDMAKAIAGAMARLDDPLAAPAGAALLEALGHGDAGPADQVAELYGLGLVASRMGARRALERLNGAGLLQGDPRLDMLRLNAALDDNGARE